MILSRNIFFLLLLVLFTSPFIISKLVWLSNSTATTGKVWFIGKTITLNGAISSHNVILFTVGKDSINFEAPINIPFKEGDPIPVRYASDDTSDAKINTFIRVWGDTLIYCLWPALVLLVIYLIPPSLDPIIPRRSKIFLNRKNIIKILPPVH